MARSAWQGQPLALYVKHLNTYGSADSWYAFHGTFVSGPLLHALDILCCAFRRLMRTTNLTGGDLFVHQSSGLARYERIAGDQGWMIDPVLLLERLFVKRYWGGQSRALRTAFSNMNFAYFQTRSRGGSSFGGYYFHGSPLYSRKPRVTATRRSDIGFARRA